VKVNDRGPSVDGRAIDLSKRAAKDLDIVEQGTAPVTITADPAQQASPKVKEAVRQQADEQVQNDTGMNRH